MNEERTRQGNGPAREPQRRIPTTNGHAGAALGDVARDVMDQVSMMARDEARLAKLSATRYVEHVKGDVVPRVLWSAVAAGAMALAGLFLLIAIFWGIAVLIGSVAWTFVIYAGAFIIGGLVAASIARRPRVETSADIERRFPAVRAHEHAPEHALARQDTEAEHRRMLEEARREASRELMTARSERLPPPPARFPDQGNGASRRP